MQEFIVSTLEDENDSDFSEGDLSLREAIANSSDGDTITFNSNLSGGTITLALGELQVERSVTIQGLGTDNLAIDANSGSRVFNIDNNSDIEAEIVINDLTIAGGSASDGLNQIGIGAGILNRENLEINNSIIRDNIAINFGGGIFSDGTLTVNNSAIYNNEAGRGAGGGIFNSGTATVNQSTIASNSDGGVRGGDGGGVGNTGTIAINNSTVTNNGSSGISNNGGEITLTSTIVAGNFDNNDLQNDDIISGGNNLIGGEATLSSTVGSVGGLANIEDSDIVGTGENPIDPRLGELQDNGGSTPTIALLEGSPAIDAGSNPLELDTDQRGEGFDRTVGGGTDIGAFELQTGGGGVIPDELVVSTLEDENDGDFSEGDLSLREAIAIANEREGEDTITFNSNLSGGTIALTQTQSDPRGLGEVNQDLNIADSVNIIGLGANNLTIDGLNGGNGIFKITGENTNFNLEGLTVANGTNQRFFINDSGGAGTIDFDGADLTLKDAVIIGGDGVFTGAISNSGNASIISSTITDNSGTAADGSFENGVIENSGTLQISNSTISENSVPGILNRGILEISNSTIANNNRDSTTNNSGSNLGSEIINTGAGTAMITSSIISGNSQQDGNERNDLSGGFTSGGNNLISDGSGGFVGGENGDIVGTADNPLDPLLGELDNGGAIPTIALLENSPAIDAGSNPNGLATDQRGEGFDRTVGAGTDIGAFELQTVVTPEVSEIVGTAGGDVLDGTQQSDRLVGLDGNDTIRGLGGDDTLQGDNGNDSLEGGAANDSLLGFDGFDSLFGGEGNDTLDAGNGNDSIDGGVGNDLLIGLGDRDTLLGGDGEDTLEGGAGVDFLDGGANNDQLFGGEDNDSLRGGNGDDLLDGGAGIDSLEGGHGNDTLFGLDGNDSLFGGNGDDFIDGGAGFDSLRGDDGNDTFVLTAGNGTDTIVDFNRGHNLLGLSSGIHFADLSFFGNDIILGDETLADTVGESNQNKFQT